MEFGLKAMPDPSRVRRNPFYERIMKDGFTIKEYYSPEDIANIKKGNLARRIDINALDEEELAALEEYKKNNAAS